MRPSPHTSDPRRRRTREALQSAFIVLALQRRYDQIRIHDLLEASGVGRSTFHEHFAGKDALLCARMEGAISLLADVPTGKAGAPQVAVLLTHFWDNRDLARGLFQGSALRVIRNARISQVEGRLARRGGDRLRLPPRLAAHALADGLFSPIVAWLSGDASQRSDDLAVALGISPVATLASMVAASSD